MTDHKMINPPESALFIGNSATHVNDIPGTLSALSGAAGYGIDARSVTRDGYTLSMFADENTDAGKEVADETRRGARAVFLQDHGNCISSDAKRAAATSAVLALDEKIRAAGGDTYIYVRPSYGTDAYGRTPLEQCIEYDRLFCEISHLTGAKCAFVNRAFAYSIVHCPLPLWGDDMAHTSVLGAYLAVCVIFSTLFCTSSGVLGAGALSDEDAKCLQNIADRIALDGVIPW